MSRITSGEGFEERHRRLEACLLALPDPQARLAWVVERGRDRSKSPEGIRVDANEVKGCASRLWLAAEWDHGRCRFRSDSESAILKAFVGLLGDLYDGLAPEEIVTNEPDFLKSTGLARQLTENRRRTLARVREAMCSFAISGSNTPSG